MATYLYRCDLCRSDHEIFAPMREGPPQAPTCLDCDALLTRIYTVPAVKAPYVEHFNESVGQYVRNDREFRDALKRGSEEATLATGLEHNYVPVDIGDIVRETPKDEAQQKRLWNEARK